MKICDKRAQTIREIIDQRTGDKNIRFYGQYGLKHNNKSASRSINELIWWIDATQAERRYLIEKFLTNYKFIDTQVRLNIKGISKIPSAIKCYYRLNSYGKLDSVRNKGCKARECPRYSSIKTWEHIIKYPATMYMKPKFILEMYKEIKTEQNNEISNEQLHSMINNIRLFIRNVDGKYRTIQPFISIKYLFRGFAIIN